MQNEMDVAAMQYRSLPQENRTGSSVAQSGAESGRPVGATLFGLGLAALLFSGAYWLGRLNEKTTVVHVVAPAAAAFQSQASTPDVELATLTTPPAAEPPVRPPLRRDEIREAQAWLNAFGFDSGPLDGVAGPRTLEAIKRYQDARQRPPTGDVDRDLLEQLRREAGQSRR